MRSPREQHRDLAEEKFENELVGLDRNDPEARAFAEHLVWMEQQDKPRYTVEGYLDGVGKFARSANRAHSHHRLIATVVVGLILAGVLVAVWDAVVFVFGTFG